MPQKPAKERTIKMAYDRHKLLLEPHGAVGWKGLHKFLDQNPELKNKEQIFVSLETAHPAKFPEEINEILHFDPELPASLIGLDEKKEEFDNLQNDYTEFKNYLLKKYN